MWAHKDQAVSVEILNKLLAEQPSNRWTDVLQTALDEYVLEVGEASQPASEFVHWLGEWCREIRRRQNHLLITTAHRAKGREFDHVVVLDGDWSRTMPREDADAPRKLFYVAMTRARDTLTLMSMDQPSKFVAELKNRPEILKREPPAEWPQTAGPAAGSATPAAPVRSKPELCRWKRTQGPAPPCHSQPAARRPAGSRHQKHSLATEKPGHNRGKAGQQIQYPGPDQRQTSEHANRKPARG